MVEPIIDRVNTRQWAMDNDYDAEKIFAKLFRTDIEYLLSMDKLWTKREKPTPLKWMNVSNAGIHYLIIFIKLAKLSGYAWPLVVAYPRNREPI